LVRWGDGEVLLRGALGEADPLGGVELDRVELLSELLILVHWDARAEHDPLAEPGDALAFPLSGGDGVEPPVDEHAEARFAPPAQPGVGLGVSALPRPAADGTVFLCRNRL